MSLKEATIGDVVIDKDGKEWIVKRVFDGIITLGTGSEIKWCFDAAKNFTVKKEG